MIDLGHDLTAVVIILLILFACFCVFMLFLLLHGDHRHQLHCQIAANAIFGHIPAIIFLHPGNIWLYVMKKPITKAFCWLLLHTDRIYEMITPYMLFMFTVERLMFIRDPTGHAQKITRAGAITLLVFPWALTILFALISINATNTDYVIQFHGPGENDTTHFCDASDKPHFIDPIIRHVLGQGIPFLASFIITITVLIMWCCYKCKRSRGTDYAMMGEQVEKNVRDSVIAVAILNFLYLFVLIGEEITQYRLPISYPLLSLFGVIEGIVWIGTLREVRNKFVRLFKHCCPKVCKSAEPTLIVTYAQEGETKAEA